MKRTAIYFCLLLALLTLCGCNQPSYAQVECVEYRSDTGYTLQVPADWTITETSDSQTAFFSADGNLALNVSSELGSMEYYSLEEVGATISEELSGTLLSQVTDSSAVQTTDHAFLQRITGPNADGQQLSITVFLYQPYTAVRYYLIFLTPADRYQDNLYLIQGVMDSLTIYMNEDELYEMTMTINTEADEAAQEELKKQFEEKSATQENEDVPIDEDTTPATPDSGSDQPQSEPVPDGQ